MEKGPDLGFARESLGAMRGVAFVRPALVPKTGAGYIDRRMPEGTVPMTGAPLLRNELA